MHGEAGPRRGERALHQARTDLPRAASDRARVNSSPPSIACRFGRLSMGQTLLLADGERETARVRDRGDVGHRAVEPAGPGTLVDRLVVLPSRPRWMPASRGRGWTTVRRASAIRVRLER